MCIDQRSSTPARIDRTVDSRRYTALLYVAISIFLTCSTAKGGDRDDTFRRTVVPFFKEHCHQCHGADLAEGDLRLDTLQADFDQQRVLGHWVEVLDRINLGEMPPQDQSRPAPETLGKVTDWITEQIQATRRKSDSTGDQILLRRLSRLEYANTIRDLLRVEFVEGEGPLDLLPPDGSVGGFDRLSKALLVDPSLLEAYFEVAARVADQAIRFRPPLVPQRTVRFEYRDTVGSAMEYLLDQRSAYLDGDTLVMMEGGARSFGKLRHPFNEKEVPITGRYRVRIRAAADPGASGKPVYMNVRQGPSDSIAQFRVEATRNEPQVYEFVTTRDELFQGEYLVSIVDGTQFTRYVAARGDLARTAQELFDAGKVRESTRIKTRLRAQGDFDTNVRGAFQANVLNLDPLPKLFLDWIEVIGPLQEAYPPESMTSFFFDGWSQDKQTIAYARKVFQRFLPRAYRRPITTTELDELMALVEADFQRSGDFESAIKTGMVATLCSPKFLFLYEPNAATTPRPLNDFEFASRLSYLLWSSKPDDPLFRLAGRDQLSDPKIVSEQVDRMLADPRVDGFLQGFVRQWLKVDEFNRFPADERIYPGYYETQFHGLDRDLEDQPLAMVRELLSKDDSILNLLDSDWTMVNERLAEHYGIDGVRGDHFRRCSLDGVDRHGNPLAIRGGLIGMAGVHRWGSDGNRTKPVERGKYILDVLFNDPPPPPPPNAGEVEPNIRGENLTVRQRLARHREQVTCNNCHRRIDPYGLALENFNVIGRWRNRLDGEKPLAHWGNDRPPIDASGTLPGGKSFTSYLEFKQSLLEQEERFLRGFVEKLLSYALGRTILSSDRNLVDTIVSQSRSEGHTLRSILRQVALTDAFRRK